MKAEIFSEMFQMLTARSRKSSGLFENVTKSSLCCYVSNALNVMINIWRNRTSECLETF